VDLRRWKTLQKDRSKAISAFLLFILITITASSFFSSVLSKDVDVPEGIKIIYYSRGSANIEVPQGWPAGGQPTTMLRIVATHIEAGNIGTGDTIFIYSYNPISPLGPWIPVAVFTTNAEALVLYRAVWSGTPLAAPTNSKPVLESALNVERHGNRILAKLTAPQSIMWAKPTIPPSYLQVTIPAFKMELDKVGGSVQSEPSSQTLIGYTGASGYTLSDDIMGFDAEGAFTCQAWSYTERPMSNSAIVMHGTRTYVPP
jgi:hypothetical protein